MAEGPFALLRAAAIDGRTRNAFYRQSQLFKLHHVLNQNAEAIMSAMVADSGITQDEAKVEYSLALIQLRQHYAEISPVKELNEEYAVAAGNDAKDLRIGVGLVVIVVHSYHSFFFSIVAPLSAAIAAGNCVILHIKDNPGSLSALIKGLLEGVLDSDTFSYAQEPNLDLDNLEDALWVIQDHDPLIVSKQNQLVSTPSLQSVAVIDRTADLEEAAEALVMARFAFKGRSPYAPDLLLVNEFVSSEFLKALVQCAIRLEAGPLYESEKSERQKTGNHDLKEFIDGLQRKYDVGVIAQESSRAILDVRKRNSQMLNEKIKEPCLLVHKVKSIDDAIDFLTSNGKQHLALYCWGGPSQCKYLSQFVNTQVAFVNHIPSEILAGPAFPINTAITPSIRYPKELFSKPAPAFTAQSSRSVEVQKILTATPPSERATALKVLQQEAISDLPLVARPKQLRAAFGFFEQAMLMNLGSVLLSTVVLISGGVYWLKHARLGQ